MHEMCSVWELDQALPQTLLAESVRLHLTIGEDFTKSLIALHTDLEASCEVLLSDIARILNLHPSDPASHQVKTTLKKFQWATSLKVNLPLMELEAAQEDLEEFLQSHLREISSQTESWELIEEVISPHKQGMGVGSGSRTWQARGVPASHSRTSEASEPLEANFFPGILEGFAGRLGLMPPGVTDPPTSSRAGVS